MTRFLNLSDIAAMIDHSLLRPNLSKREFQEGIDLAIRYGCATACVRPSDVLKSSKLLSHSVVRVSTVVGFPHGSSTTDTEVFEARTAVENGAQELDMVLAVGRLVSEDLDCVEEDVQKVVEAVHPSNVVVKVIFETCYLNCDQIVAACRVSERSGADYVKTSTGYGPRGASVEDVRLTPKSCSPDASVKAAGGIRTIDDLLAFRAAGSNMIWTRSTAAILDAAAGRLRNGTIEVPS